MALSLGIEYGVAVWRTALLEHLVPIETKAFAHAEDVRGYVEGICACYPEPVIAVAIQHGHDCRVQGAEADEMEEVRGTIEAIKAMNLTSYRLPEVRELASIPRYRKLNRAHMGTAGVLCSTATLLYRLRLQEAAWPEIRFLFLSIDEKSRNIVVIQEGQIVDGIARPLHEALYQETADDEVRQLVEAAFWEGLSQDLAGLMAIHHCEDIVLLTHKQPAGMRWLHDEIVTRLSDLYPCYLFPTSTAEQDDFEAAIGAGIIVEGLHHNDVAGEVVERLHLVHLPHL